MKRVGVSPAVRASRYRGGAYFLLQALVALTAILVLYQPLPEPPLRYRLTEATLFETTSQRRVRLPIHLPRSPSAPRDASLLTFSFERPVTDSGQVWSIFLPRFTNGVEVAINGAVVLDSRRNPGADRPDRNSPAIAVIPAPLLRDGENNLAIRLFAHGPLSGFLDQVFVGPDDALRPAFDQRSLLFLTLPVVFAAWQAVLAAILGVIWLNRRHKPAYGLLAAAMVLGTIQAVVSAPEGESARAVLSLVLFASAPIESALVLVSVVLACGLKLPRYTRAIFLPGLLIALVGLMGDSQMVRRAYLLLGAPTVGFCLIAIWLVVGHAAMRRRDIGSLLLGGAVTVVLTCWFHDILSVSKITSDRRILVARLSYSALLIAIGGGLTWRFIKALTEVDSFAARMVGLVREAEDKLRASWATEERLIHANALAAERTRLMHDLHDGLGGQLVSIVALSERDEPDGHRIGEAARGAIKDLRLVIDAMDDIDGDLMLALGSWRERTEAQLRPHRIELEWAAEARRGLPLHPELRPWHVLQILRLLDEAVTNAVKHSGATLITVWLEAIDDAGGTSHGRITVEDNGHGFLKSDTIEAHAPRSARGLANMRRRAASCGATLYIASGPTGTRAVLDLPTRFPTIEGEPAESSSAVRRD